MRPRFVNETAAAMLALSIASLFQINGTMTAREVEMIGLMFGVRCAVTWEYWSGRNWARILAVMYSVCCLVRLIVAAAAQSIGLQHVATTLTRALWIGEALLAAFLIVYLRQNRVAKWFTGRERAPESPVVETLPADKPVFEPVRTDPLQSVLFDPEPLYAHPEPAVQAPRPVMDGPLLVARGLSQPAAARNEIATVPRPRRRPVVVVIRIRCSWLRVRPVTPATIG